MLAHPTAYAARLHDALVLASLSHGVLDLHALITTRLQVAQALGAAAPSVAASPWTLRDLMPACFAARELRLTPPGARAPAAVPAPPSDAAVPDAAGVISLTVALPHALRIIDALVALGGAKLWRHPSDDAAHAPTAWAHLSRHERATLAAALATPRWPTVTLAPAYAPAAAYARGGARGQRLGAALRAHTPVPGRVFVWLGPRICTDLLSPYVRDVGGALRASGPATLRGALDVDERPAAHAYGLAAQLMRVHPALAAERAAAEASVGIAVVDLGDTSAECVTLAELDAAACDEHVATLVADASCGTDVVCRLPYAHSEANGLEAAAPGFEAAGLLDTLAAVQPLAGVAICLPAAIPQSSSDVRWGGGPAAAPISTLVAEPGPGPRDLDTAAARHSAQHAVSDPGCVVVGAQASAAAGRDIAPGAALATEVLSRWLRA